MSRIAMAYENVLSKVDGNSVVIADRMFSVSKYWSNYYGNNTSDYVEFLIEQIRKKLKEIECEIYLISLENTDKSIILRNIKARGRPEEQHYTKEDLDILEKVYKGHINDLRGLDYTIHCIDLGKAFYENGAEMIEEIICSNSRMKIGYDEVDLI
jgi:thymidylate kinase